MEAQKVRYLYNDKGEREFALVPIAEWEEIQASGEDPQGTQPSVEKYKKYKGIFDNQPFDEVIADFEAMRHEV